jgi:hypothetical protein
MARNDDFSDEELDLIAKHRARRASTPSREVSVFKVTESEIRKMLGLSEETDEDDDDDEPEEKKPRFGGSRRSGGGLTAAQ